MLQSSVAFAVMVLVLIGARALWRRRPLPVPGPVPLVDGQLVLRPPRQYALLLGVGTLFPTGLIASVTARSWMLGRMGAASLAGGAVVTVLALSVSVHQFLSAFRSRLVADDTGLERVGVLMRRRVGWRDVARVVYNPVQRWFYVTTTRGTRFWIPEDLPGMAQLADLALRRLPTSVLGADPDAREVLEDLAGPARESLRS
ncbi:PH domain-containing protein [Anaeromyxobacter oryzae]|uniref:Low molecular weight protein antigen 6 PH domain-containing protein n=1 Tax=Anaeromyxobacter oryzae TaxID=2918170 RepID=A0ABN6MM61_9BACT|nr:PH domain-containing protein [Anaeromyxobacter oryzae]BDG01411.1 hypothetical protein AMOR_04070 [Anaeromyxobacter oryzae]